VVQDLSTAHRVFKQQQSSSAPLQIVTLNGQIVHGDGRLSGGRGGESNVLARERERRGLPRRVQKATKELAQARESLAQLQDRVQRSKLALEAGNRTIRQLRSETAKQTAQQAEARRQLDLARQREEWYRDLVAKTAAEQEQLRTNADAVTTEMEQSRARQAELRTALAEAQQALAEVDAAALQAQLAAAQAELALCESQRDGIVALLEGQREALTQVSDQIQAKEAQSTNLASRLQELDGEIASQRTTGEELAAQLQKYATLIEPAEAELSELSSEQATLEKKERSLQERLRDEEMRVSRASLAVERSQDDLQTLHREIEADLGPIKASAVDTLTFLQPLLPLQMPVERLPAVEELPEGMEADIRRLRRQERRMANVNPNAPEEYAEALERHSFLTEQVSDLERASESLQEVIAELDQLMEQALARTFREIATQFKEYFNRLFDGGSARLQLTDPENLTQTGVEIVARPPGKRTQSLALLSGGERSLTAIALIFAILKISPPPFCVLDEVDAMLDEANVGRFRNLLKELSEETQFVIITHNRHTVQAANTIYGVSMGADSASQVVSLKLHGEQLAS
jgi:chromosome segregation protein